MDTKYHEILWLKIVTVMLFLGIVPLLVLGTIIYYQSRAAYEKIIVDTLQTSALDTGRAVDLFLNERVSELFTIARTQTLDQLKNRVALDKIFLGLKDACRFFSAVEIVNNRGKRIAYAGLRDSTSETFDKLDKDWVRRVLSSGVYVSDVFEDYRNEPHFFVAAASAKESGWILRGTVKAEALDKIMRSAPVGKKGYAFIVSKNNLLQTTPHAGEKQSLPFYSSDLFASTRTKDSQILYRGKDSFAAAIPIRSGGWVLVLGENFREQMVPLLEVRRTGVFIAAACILFILGSAVLTARSIVKGFARFSRQEQPDDNTEMQSGKMMALDRMAAGIAHEVNNPLAIIGGMAGWMKDLLGEEDIRASKNFETYKDCLAKIEREVRRCKMVTQRLLSFGRSVTPSRAAVDVNHLLVETVSLFESEAYFRDIGIHATYGDRLPPVTTDPTKLQQVFFDIFDESIDAVGKYGSINVNTSCERDRQELLITISRSGSESSSANIAEVTGSVPTVDASGTRSAKRFSDSHSVISESGGTISVADPVAGHRTFTIRLPVTESSHPVPEVEQLRPGWKGPDNTTKTAQANGSQDTKFARPVARLPHFGNQKSGKRHGRIESPSG
ncbi:MAG: cache domain-containing protein [Desulfomonilaceae bacterium]